MPGGSDCAARNCNSKSYISPSLRFLMFPKDCKRIKKMYDLFVNGTWKKITFIIFISCGILLTVSYYDYAKLLNYHMVIPSDIDKEAIPIEANNSEDKDRYLISSSKCKILNLDPYSNDAKKYFKRLKYKSCTKKELLTYVTKEDNIATVHIDNEIIQEYSKKPISCCYSNVLRSSSPKNPDDSIKIQTCKDFQDNTTLTEEAIHIKCTQKGSKTKIYENVHTSVRITNDVRKKIKKFDNSTNKPLSVLFIGIDSISRLNFIRALPNTYKYVEDNGWLSLKGYNKMDDNTFPNLMAILAGFNQSTAYNICNPKAVGFLDKCPLLWYKYNDFGYVTGYAEDAAKISTFNYYKKGFIKRPTDYYFRPYIMATEKLNKGSGGLDYCTGPETAGERIINLVKDFSATFINNSNFGFFWMNTYSHNDISTPTMMDNKLKTLLTGLEHSGVTENSLIIFLSDHGIRFGEIRSTETGWLEERLPFIYFSFPPWFKETFPKQYENFKNNEYKFTTPYDLHMTLQHILVLSGFNYTIKPSDACPKCLSLFEEIPSERSCEDANIEDHWCTCVAYTTTKLAYQAEQRLSDFVINQLNKIVQDHYKVGGEKCAKYSSASMTVRSSHKFSYKNTSYVLINIRTFPKAVFETTITYEGDIMKSNLSMGPVSRLDYYLPYTGCISDAYLKKLCYCR